MGKPDIKGLSLIRDGTRYLREQNAQRIEIFGDPSRIRTCNPRSRNPLLYPVELWDRRGQFSTANMKNPLPRQARSEPLPGPARQSRAGRSAWVGSALDAVPGAGAAQGVWF